MPVSSQRDLEEEIRELGAYEVTEHRQLDDVGSDSYVLRHVKSGARIALLPNEDSNKVFCIAFRTPPKDSTGVSHIIEHTVLCGSRDFPVKDPFVELVKGSLNTFLNAMTYPDKTVYPVASTNEKDFDNLMHVYLDAVFHPNIYTEQNIFRQEGWHYEVSEDGAGAGRDAGSSSAGGVVSPDEEAPAAAPAGSADTAVPVITVNGVVYNEMKGVMSSPDDVLNDLVLESLFPDTTYAIVSGGDPEVIPTLTYEQYLEFHRRYYHPSNSYIYLYGDMDVIERLRFLDEKYLSEYEKIEVDSAVRAQTPFARRREVTRPYSIQEGEDPEGRAYLSWNAALPIQGNPKEILAFRVLDYVLCDAEGAPVREALRERGIGQDVESLYEAGLAQPYYSITAKYASAGQKEAFLETITSVLRRLSEEGIPRRLIAAGINYHEFQYREADFGSWPRGLVYGLDILDTWLYDDASVWTNLEVGQYYEELKKDAEQGYFEELIRRLLLDNPHESLAVLEPDPGLTGRKEEAQRRKMAAFAASLSLEELARIREEEASLRRWQETPDREEDLRKIPVLSRSDLGRRAQVPVNERITEHVVGHRIFTGGIDYVDLTFDVTDFSPEQVRLAALLKTLLCALDTQAHSYSELDNEINIATGGMSPGISTVSDAHDPSQYRVLFNLSFKTLHGNLGQALQLAKEILLETHFEDAGRIRTVLEEECASMKTELPASGHGTAVSRAASYLSDAGKIGDDLSGIGAYRTLERITAEYDAVKGDLAAALEALLPAVLRGKAEADVTAGDEDLEDAAGQLETLLREIKEAAGAPGEAPAGFSFLSDRPDFRCVVQAEGLSESDHALPEEGLPVTTETPQAEDSADSSRKEGGVHAVREVDVSGSRYPNEGFTTAGQVQYVCRAGNYLKKGLPFTGVLRVLKVVLGYDYLWTHVRMKGGAYGCMSGFGRDGCAWFVSYRDPHLRQTIETFEGAAEAIRGFDADEITMTKYVIGAVSAMDRPMTPRMFGQYSRSCRLLGVTQEELQREREQVLDCTPEDIRAMADYIEAFMEDGALCVIGAAGKLTAAGELFGSVEAL